MYRRNFFRKPANIPVALRLKAGAGKPVVFSGRGFITDLSVQGAFIIKAPQFSPERIADLLSKKSKLDLEFFLPNLKIPIMTSSRLRWVEKPDEFFPHSTGMGVEFDDISKEDVLEILRYIAGEVKHKHVRKREFLRMPVHIPIGFGKKTEAAVSNISVGGVCLKVKPALGRLTLSSMQKNPFTIKLKLNKQALSLQGLVRWAENFKIDGENISKVGIEFLNPDSQQRKSLTRFVLSVGESVRN